MADYVLHIVSWAGTVPGAVHYRGRIEGEHPRSCHGGTTYHGGGPPELHGKTTCAQDHVLPERTEWRVEAPWTEARYERWAAAGFEGPGPEQFTSEQDVITAAAGRFLATLPARWWEGKAVPGQPGDKLWAAWVPRPEDRDLVQENWGTVIAEVPDSERSGDST
jgi:hypothetical protein